MRHKRLPSLVTKWGYVPYAAIPLLALTLACGGGGGGGTPTPTPTPTPTNHAPVFTSTASTVAQEGHAYTYVVVATDADNDTITLTAPTLPTDAKFDATTKTITWTPRADQKGVAQDFSLVASDGKTTTPQTWKVTPTANALPVFSTTLVPSTVATQGVPYTFTCDATDADGGDTVALSKVILPDGATFDATTKTITWIPTAPQVGVTQNFDLQADDGHGGTSHLTWAVTVAAINHAPAFTNTPSTTAKAGHLYTYDATATDADSGDTVTLSAVTLPTGATFNITTKTLTWTPTDAQANVVQTFDLLADDGHVGGTTHKIWTVTPAANAVPTFTSTPPSSIPKAGHPYTYTVSLPAVDADGDPVTLTAPTLPAGANWDATSKTITWTPSDAQAGHQLSFGLLASDAHGGTFPQNWLVTPTANALPHVTSVHPTAAATVHTLSYTLMATDADSDTLAYSVNGSLPGGAAFDINTHILTWTPTVGQVGTAQPFDLQVNDGHGGVKHDIFSITPTANQAPVFTTPNPATTVTTGQLYSYTPVATDAEGDTLTYTLQSGPSWALLTGGVLSGTPGVGDFTTSVAFTVRADDGHGQHQNRTWNVMVKPATNSAPSITSTPTTTALLANGPYTYSLTGTDPDSGTTGDTITYTLQSGPAGASITGTTLTWTIGSGQHRIPENFDVVAQDQWGAPSSHQTWTVTSDGTIAGTRNSQYTPLAFGTTGVAYDPHANTLSELHALVPNGTTFDTYPNSGGSTVSGTTGEFTIATVPGGHYWLQLGTDTYIWTDKSNPNLDAYQEGRVGTAKATNPTVVTFSGTADTWAAGHLLQYYDWNTGGSINLNQVTGHGGDPANSANPIHFDLVVDFSAANFQGNLVAAASGDHPLVVHAAPVVLNTKTVFVASEVAEIAGFTLANGGTANPALTFSSLSGGTPHPDPTTFNPNWSLLAFAGDPIRTATSNSATLEGSDLVLAAAYDLAKTGLGNGYTVDLARLTDGGTANIDLRGTNISYVALPSAPFTRTTVVETSYLTNLQLAASVNGGVPLRTWVTAFTTNPSLMSGTTPIAPLVTPVTGMLFNGHDCFAHDIAGVSQAQNVLSWTAATGAQGYQVYLYELVDNGSHHTVVSSGTLFVTADHQITLPATAMVTGHTYVFKVQAIHSYDPNHPTDPLYTWDPTLNPLGFIQTAEYGYAETLSAIITAP